MRCLDFPKIQTMSRIIRVIIQNSLYENKNREEVNNREIKYLSDLSIVNLLSVYILGKSEHLVYLKSTFCIHEKNIFFY